MPLNPLESDLREGFHGAVKDPELLRVLRLLVDKAGTPDAFSRGICSRSSVLLIPVNFHCHFFGGLGGPE
jgi:hypothetical protein